MDVLITGGAGFIGSTVASALLDRGHRPVVLDNLVTGRREFTSGRAFYEADIADAAAVRRVFEENPAIECVVHCAALIVVPDSVTRPIDYYRANVVKTLDFVSTLIDLGVPKLIFSSSAAIYATAEDFSVDESSPITPLSPYARTKAVTEHMLADIAAATDLRVMSLRYFNPIGADPQLRTGLQIPEPTHALGKLITAYERGEPFVLTGDDYPTRDGSGIRDYVHVWDLATAHVDAVEKFDAVNAGAHSTVINLGTGHGTTVLELVEAFNRVVGGGLRVERGPRRPGDSAGAYTRSEKAERLLGWTASRSIDEGIRDALAWFEKRPSVLPDLA
jgi:UDP-glucose 4-epimerase